MIYERFEQLCKEKNMSPAQLSAKLGLAKGNTTLWKKGGNPSMQVLIAICNELECTPGYLLGTEDISIIMKEILSPVPVDWVSAWKASSICLRKGDNNYIRKIKKEIDDIIEFVNCDPMYLMNEGCIEYTPVLTEKEYVDVILKKYYGTEIIPYILMLFNRVPADKSFFVIQLQLSRIVVYNLAKIGITKETLEGDNWKALMTKKLHYIYDGTKSLNQMYNLGFNASEIDYISETSGYSFQFLFTGVMTEKDKERHFMAQ